MGGLLRTVLFTDIEGSTARWEADADAMSASLTSHDEALTAAIEGHGGLVFKHTGDGMCAVFESPVEAVAAALEAQSDLAVPVRMGLHTGEVELRDGDFFGPAVNRCARVMDAGHGGQVLVSATTASLLDGAVALRDLGLYVLKGFTGTTRLFQIGPEVFPSLRAPQPSSRLPSVETTMLGREELVNLLVEAVAAHRLVTLTGAGGVGKTRVALAAARLVENEGREAVFIALQEVDDRGVLPALAQAMGLKNPTWDSVESALGYRPMLLVVDNCEHVLDAAADLAARVLAGATDVRILATSRESLAVPGEQVVPVVPFPRTRDDPVAIALFEDRARAKLPDLHFDDDQREAIGRLCDRLDGLPLAIELAAARASVLSPDELLARLDERFRVLDGPLQRRGRDRARTLRETVVWSFDLLEPDEQIAFARLGAFAGSFQIPSAAAVLELDELDTLDVVEALADRSLLVVEDHPEGRRYRYLETVRAFAEDRLRTEDLEDDAVAAVHRHMVEVVVPAIVERVYQHPRNAAAQLDREVPNLRRAFDAAISARDPAMAASVIVPLGQVASNLQWPVHGWADEALSLPGAVGSTVEPGLRALTAIERWLANDFSAALRINLAVLEMDQTPRPLPDHLWSSIAGFLTIAARKDLTRILWQERRDAGMNDIPGDGVITFLLPPDAALDFVESQLDDPRSAPAARAVLHYWRAAAALHRGAATEDTIAQAERAAETAAVGSAAWFVALQLAAQIALEIGDVERALDIMDTDIEQAYRIDDRSALILPMAAYATALELLDQPETAAMLRGRLPRRLTIMFVDDLADLDRWLSTRLAPDTLMELRERGAAMEPRDLRDLARSVIDPLLGDQTELSGR